MEVRQGCSTLAAVWPMWLHDEANESWHKNGEGAKVELDEVGNILIFRVVPIADSNQILQKKTQHI